MKLVLSVAAVAGAFVVVLLGGGSAIGVWKELDLPATSAAADRAAQRSKENPAAKKATVTERRARAKARARRAATNRWVRAVNKLCRSAKAEAAAVPNAKSLAEMESQVARLAELSARYNARVAALPPPPGQRAKIARLERLFAKDEALLTALRDAVQHRRPARIVRLSERVADVSEREKQLLYDLGARQCALQ